MTEEVAGRLGLRVAFVRTEVVGFGELMLSTPIVAVGSWTS